MKNLLGVNVFKAGTWNGQTFTEADLDSIVTAFQEADLTGRVPLKYGHNPEQAYTDGKPALGWVTKLWREGIDLMANFSSLPNEVYESVKAGLYRFTSIELLKNAEVAGKNYPYLLDAVALLGADPPAVAGLADMQRLAMGAKREYPVVTSSARLHFRCESGGDDDPELEKLTYTREQYQALEARVEHLIQERDHARAEALTFKRTNIDEVKETEGKRVLQICLDQIAASTAATA